MTGRLNPNKIISTASYIFLSEYKNQITQVNIITLMKKILLRMKQVLFNHVSTFGNTAC